MIKYPTRYVGISSAPVGAGWSAVSSVLSLERWACPSQITRLKTASWQWRRASWGCPLTPACWSLPSWSGGWGESPNLPLRRRFLQTPEVCSHLCPYRAGGAGGVHRWEYSWGQWPRLYANEALTGVWRGCLSSISHLNIREGSSLYWIETLVLRLFLT